MKHASEKAYQRIVEGLVIASLLIYPSLMIAVKGGMNGAFALLLLLSVIVLVFRLGNLAPVIWDREMTVFLVAMAALPVVIFLSQSYHGHYSAHPYDAASRFLLSVPILLLLRRMRFDVIAMVQYGFPLATIMGFFAANELKDGRLLLPFLDLIHFGDFELLLGVLSVLSINWTGRDALAVRILKIAGFIAGVYVSLKTGSRGGWIALPVFAFIFVHYKLVRLSLKTMTVTLMTLAIMSLPIYIFNSAIHDRVNMVGSDLQDFKRGNPDTDTGIRLQLYKAATLIFLKHPFLGVGPEGFKLEMEPMVKSGEITAIAANMGNAEVHNELLSKAAGLGVFGLLGLLAIYLAPLRMYYRATQSSIAEIRNAGILGLAFVSGFMVFGLTVEILNLTMAAAFYSLTVAVLLAACTNVHHGNLRTSGHAYRTRL